MSGVPALSHETAVKAFQKAGFVSVGQRGSHLRLQKRVNGRLVKLIVPMHRNMKKTTMERLVKAAGLSQDEFGDAVRTI